MPQTGLVVRGLGKTFKSRPVLRDVSLQVERGEAVGLLGPNGAGKTTSFYCVTGLISPDQGRIYLDGQDITALQPADVARLGLVRSFQISAVFPHMSALDNVMFGAECQAPLAGRLFGRRRREARETAAVMLEHVGLGDALNVYPRELSGGMQQRLAIAQALITHPRILLLDEPFGALDPGVRLDMHELILGLWREHSLTILMVTHDIKEAFKLGTRVLGIDKRRRDPQAPHRYGSTAVYDLPLDDKRRAVPAEIAAMATSEA